MPQIAAKEEDDVAVSMKVVPVGLGYFVQGQATAAVAARCRHCGATFQTESSSTFESW